MTQSVDVTQSAAHWTGYHYDGRTAHREPVTVTPAADGLRIARADGATLLWPYNELRQTAGVFEREQLRFEFGDDPVQVLAVNEPGLAAAIRSLGVTSGRVRLPRSTARVLTWSLGIIAIVAGTYAWGVPIFADWAAPRVPVAWEASLGRMAVEELATKRRRCDANDATLALRVIVDRLLTGAPATSYEFTLLVVDDSTVNAFAGPGGFVVVNSGLLRAARTPEELAGVLAHEMQHVLQRHPTRGMIREIPLQLAISALSSGSGVDAAAKTAGTLSVMRYRRNDERAADREGMRMLHAARVDASGMVSFMRTLQERHADAPRLVSYLSSHPPTAERVAELTELAREAPDTPAPLMDESSWRIVQSICDQLPGESAVRTF